MTRAETFMVWLYMRVGFPLQVWPFWVAIRSFIKFQCIHFGIPLQVSAFSPARSQGMGWWWIKKKCYNKNTAPAILSETTADDHNWCCLCPVFPQSGCRVLWLHHPPSVGEQNQLPHSDKRWNMVLHSQSSHLFYILFLSKVMCNHISVWLPKYKKLKFSWNTCKKKMDSC